MFPGARLNGRPAGERPPASRTLPTRLPACVWYQRCQCSCLLRFLLHLSASPAARRRYVTRKDPSTNAVYVSRQYHEADKQRNSFACGAFSWCGDARPDPARPLLCKVRRAAGLSPPPATHATLSRSVCLPPCMHAAAGTAGGSAAQGPGAARVHSDQCTQ